MHATSIDIFDSILSRQLGCSPKHVERNSPSSVVYFRNRLKHVYPCTATSAHIELMFTSHSNQPSSSFPLPLKGEMGYVKQDISKAIKAVLNGASGGFREQASDLKRVGEHIRQVFLSSWYLK